MPRIIYEVVAETAQAEANVSRLNAEFRKLDQTAKQTSVGSGGMSQVEAVTRKATTAQGDQARQIGILEGAMRKAMTAAQGHNRTLGDTAMRTATVTLAMQQSESVLMRVAKGWGLIGVGVGAAGAAFTAAAAAVSAAIVVMSGSIQHFMRESGLIEAHRDNVDRLRDAWDRFRYTVGEAVVGANFSVELFVDRATAALNRLSEWVGRHGATVSHWFRNVALTMPGGSIAVNAVGIAGSALGIGALGPNQALWQYDENGNKVLSAYGRLQQSQQRDAAWNRVRSLVTGQGSLDPWSAVREMDAATNTAAAATAGTVSTRAKEAEQAAKAMQRAWDEWYSGILSGQRAVLTAQAAAGAGMGAQYINGSLVMQNYGPAFTNAGQLARGTFPIMGDTRWLGLAQGAGLAPNVAPVNGALIAAANAKLGGGTSPWGSWLTGVPSTILGAFMGGGNVSQSIFGSLGGGAGAALAGGLGLLSSTSATGLGMALGSAFPIVGTLAGGFLGKMLGGLFGPKPGAIAGKNADAQIGQLQAGLLAQYGSLSTIAGMGPAGAELAAGWGSKNVQGLSHFQGLMSAFEDEQTITGYKDTLLETYGTLDNIRLLDETLGTQMAETWDTGKVKDFESAMHDLGKKQSELQSALDRYGLTWKNLGESGKQFFFNQEASQLLKDFDLLIQAGMSEEDVLKAMSASWAQLYADALETGAGMPAAMEPILRKLMEMALLVDENGTKITELGGHFVEMKDTATQAYDDMIRKAKDAQRESEGLTWTDPTAKWGSPGERGSAAEPDAYAARGGYVGYGMIRYLAGGGWQPRGTDTVRAMLSPGEGVLSRLGMQALGRLNRGEAVGGSKVVNVTVNLSDTVMDGISAQRFADKIGEAIMTRARFTGLRAGAVG